jgi:hypothetical protein
MLFFARPRRVPLEWLRAQYRLGRTPGFLEAQLAWFELRSASGGSARYCWVSFLAFRSQRSSCGEPATQCSRSPKQGTRLLVSQTAPCPSLPTAATYPTSSVPICSWQPSESSLADVHATDGRQRDGHSLREAGRELPGGDCDRRADDLVGLVNRQLYPARTLVVRHADRRAASAAPDC